MSEEEEEEEEDQHQQHQQRLEERKIVATKAFRDNNARVVTFTKKRGGGQSSSSSSSERRGTHAFRWIEECFRVRGTVLVAVLPQMMLGFAIGILANALKIRRCGKGVMEAEECDVAFSVDGHTSVAVVLSFLLVFRVNLAHEKWDEAREATERVRDGVRNLNVAFCSFVCASSFLLMPRVVLRDLMRTERIRQRI